MGISLPVWPNAGVLGTKYVANARDTTDKQEEAKRMEEHLRD